MAALVVGVLIISTVGTVVGVLVGLSVEVGGMGVGESRSLPCTLLG